MSEEVKNEVGAVVVTRDDLVSAAAGVANEDVQLNMIRHSKEVALAERIVFRDEDDEGKGFEKVLKEKSAPKPKDDEPTPGFKNIPSLVVDEETAREITAHRCGEGMDEQIEVLACDEPGPGGACHQYAILIQLPDGGKMAVAIQFQKGPVLEAGLNGISCESLLAIVKDRLEGFQSGGFVCLENEQALEGVDYALSSLHGRTNERATAGAEGTSAGSDGEAGGTPAVQEAGAGGTPAVQEAGAGGTPAVQEDTADD